jgi:hypothetical protein
MRARFPPSRLFPVRVVSESPVIETLVNTNTISLRCAKEFCGGLLRTRINVTYVTCPRKDQARYSTERPISTEIDDCATRRAGMVSRRPFVAARTRDIELVAQNVMGARVLRTLLLTEIAGAAR